MALEMSGGMTADERSAIERFPRIAEEFCHLIDACDKRNRKQLVQDLAVHLAKLCEVAVRLPWVEPATEDIDNTPEAVAAHTQGNGLNYRTIFVRFLDLWTATGKFLTPQKKKNQFLALSPLILLKSILI